MTQFGKTSLSAFEGSGTRASRKNRSRSNRFIEMPPLSRPISQAGDGQQIGAMQLWPRGNQSLPRLQNSSCRQLPSLLWPLAVSPTTWQEAPGHIHYANQVSPL